MFARPGARVLDLGCGHGTDLLKYSINHIGEYVGVDISVESLREAVRRYNAYNPTFNATFVHADLTQQSINRDDVLEPGMVFDMVASNLTLQFAWTSEIAVRTYLRNATDRLLPGGYIIGCFPDPIKIMQHLVASPDHTNVHIGNICTLKFRKYLDEINQTVDPFAIIYDVTLGEVMKDIPEYLISLPTLEKVALEYGLEPRLMLNFHDFYNSYRFLPPFRSLLAKHDAPEDIAAIPADEWDVLSLYTVFVFQKQIGAPMRRLGALSETDIISVE
jgi:mRNA (guanine-N7-)-methyltransferase